MLATGTSLVYSYEALVAKGGMPKELHVVSVIASEAGVEYLEKHLPHDANIWCASVDPELSAQSYIIPGLGDAGDLAYGSKLD